MLINQSLNRASPPKSGPRVIRAVILHDAQHMQRGRAIAPEVRMGAAVGGRSEAPDRNLPEQETVNQLEPLSWAEGDGDDTQVSFVRRHPFLVALSAAAIALTIVGCYVYWDNASHFVSTEGAFNAARQFAVAQQVSPFS